MGEMVESLHHTDQLALLLSVLGQQATETALKSVNEETAAQVRSSLESFRLDPPSKEEIEFVLDDFAKYFRFALNTVGVELDKQEKEKEDAEESEEIHETHAAAASQRFPVPDLSGNTINDLAKFHPYQIASSLKNDHPKTIAMVLQNLPAELAGRVLELIPDSSRSAAFLQFSKPSTIPRPVQDNVLKTVLEKTIAVEYMVEDEDPASRVANLARSLRTDMRGPMLEELMKNDDELAAAVKSKMYMFSDLARLDDRSLQTVLGQINTDLLAFALQGAEREITERILGNISKRARQNLEEEMEFKQGAKEAEIEQSRKSIAEVLARLDESGEISLE